MAYISITLFAGIRNFFNFFVYICTAILKNINEI